jgi:hypothetical protein
VYRFKQFILRDHAYAGLWPACVPFVSGGQEYGALHKLANGLAIQLIEREIARGDEEVCVDVAQKLGV